eukprot:CAMPEP_0177614058 /NCGR_PEP_ID=MMETSP0419_2-20121207/22408_1 /TAXON_ID=582737 /ORGANISM="Tetraselmis sp., Strain GSL018" /LENGTH=329 /DNA_ID=CAMNT_0019111001 /DNA_START=405 /DNA_END=1394 /DNA_ORIENTATION=-
MKRSGSQLMHVVLREDPGVADDPEDELRDGLQPAPVLAAADVIDAHHRRKELGSAPGPPLSKGRAALGPSCRSSRCGKGPGGGHMCPPPSPVQGQGCSGPLVPLVSLWERPWRRPHVPPALPCPRAGLLWAPRAARLAVGKALAEATCAPRPPLSKGRAALGPSCRSSRCGKGPGGGHMCPPPSPVQGQGCSGPLVPLVSLWERPWRRPHVPPALPCPRAGLLWAPRAARLAVGKALAEATCAPRPPLSKGRAALGPSCRSSRCGKGPGGGHMCPPPSPVQGQGCSGPLVPLVSLWERPWRRPSGRAGLIRLSYCIQVLKEECDAPTRS